MQYRYGPQPPYTSPPQMPHGKPTPWWIIFTIIGTTVLVTSIVCGLFAIVLARMPSTSSSNGLPATQLPAPTATSTPGQIINTAVIGGTTSDFTSQYGTSADVQGVPVYHEPLASLLDINIFLSKQDTGSDGKPHVSIVQVALDKGESWTERDERTACRFFVPRLSEPIREDTFDIGGAKVDEEIFQSADLAATFPASLFSDDQHNSVTPGTFAIDFLPDPNDPTHPFGGAGHCELSLGKH